MHAVVCVLLIVIVEAFRSSCSPPPPLIWTVFFSILIRVLPQEEPDGGRLRKALRTDVCYMLVVSYPFADDPLPSVSHLRAAVPFGDGGSGGGHV
jgi:hypothetical protein